MLAICGVGSEGAAPVAHPILGPLAMRVFGHARRLVEGGTVARKRCTEQQINFSLLRVESLLTGCRALPRKEPDILEMACCPTTRGCSI